MIEMNEADSLSRDLQSAQLARVARRSAKILKIVAVVLAVGAVANGWLNATIDQNEFYGNPSVDFPFKWKLQQFLFATLGNLGFAGLVLAAGFALEIVALRSARLPDPSADLSEFTSASPEQTVATTNFAARPTPPPTPPPTASPSPPPMKIANDEIWRR